MKQAESVTVMREVAPDYSVNSPSGRRVYAAGLTFREAKRVAVDLADTGQVVVVVCPSWQWVVR